MAPLPRYETVLKRKQEERLKRWKEEEEDILKHLKTPRDAWFERDDDDVFDFSKDDVSKSDDSVERTLNKEAPPAPATDAAGKELSDADAQERAQTAAFRAAKADGTFAETVAKALALEPRPLVAPIPEGGDTEEEKAFRIRELRSRMESRAKAKMFEAKADLSQVDDPRGAARTSKASR